VLLGSALHPVPFGFPICAVVSHIPSWMLERWYRARRRREAERILPPL
jgi:hypothetical protein